MRPHVPLLILALMLVLAPVALADGPSSGKGRSDAAKLASAEHRANESHDDDDDDNETDDGHRGNKSARDANRTAWRENHSAMIEGFVAQLKALQTSWHENATKVREGCHNATFDKENATKENRTARAHCIRDGYADWRAEHRADIRELREQLKTLFESWHPKKHRSD